MPRWYAYSAQLSSENVFPLIDFKSAVRIGYLDLADNGEKTLEWLSAKNCRVLYATHIHEIASYADEINKSERSRGKIDFLCAELQGKERSYKIVRGKRSRGSHAMDIFEKYGIGFLAEK